MTPLHSAVWAMTRAVFGLSMALFHGYPKVFGGKMDLFAGGVANLGFPAPKFFAWCAALAELGGGLLLAAGLATRGAAGLLGFTMLVALFHHRNDPWAKRELALLYLVYFATVLALGAGRYSLDALLRRVLRRGVRM